MRIGPLLQSTVFLPWHVLLAGKTAAGKVLRSARFWILFLFLLVAVLICYYALANTYTPSTNDAYVQAFVVQVACSRSTRARSSTRCGNSKPTWRR